LIIDAKIESILRTVFKSKAAPKTEKQKAMVLLYPTKNFKFRFQKIKKQLERGV
jgi:hypothetical protein